MNKALKGRNIKYGVDYDERTLSIYGTNSIMSRPFSTDPEEADLFGTKLKRLHGVVQWNVSRELALRGVSIGSSQKMHVFSHFVVEYSLILSRVAIISFFVSVSVA